MSSLSPAQREEWLTKLLDTARAASEIVMRIYGEPDPGTEYKSAGDPVTRADKEANALILERLGRDFPGVPIVAEESDPATFKGFETSSLTFFVDPLDGTRDFIARNGEFCVMIGVAEEGRATIGVVLCPAIARGAYLGAEGVGAFLVREDGSRETLKVSSMDNIARVRCAVSRFHRSKSVDAKLQALECKELIPVGSSGIKGIQVASATLELYAHPSRGFVKLWDACAPEAIVRAAGGVYTDAKGRDFNYRGSVSQGTGTVAGNPEIHAQAIRKFVEYDQRTGGETMS
jgi:3'(2'), 5'-bisphosphate nucleotidase